jgi:RNA polymerase subunit RPABC4/transcription elongation factor Spt4
MICSRCHNSIPDNIQYCPVCGFQVGTYIQPLPNDTQPQTKLKKSKVRYCSRCGSSIDGETKKCTGCGRQYFRGLHINKFVALLLILLPLLAGSIGINAYLYLQIQDMEMHLVTLQSHCTELQQEVEDLEKSNEDALIVIADQQEHIEELKTIIAKLRKGENVPLTFSEWKEQQKENEESGS